MTQQIDTSLRRNSEENLRALERVQAEDVPKLSTADYESLQTMWAKVQQCEGHVTDAQREVEELTKLLSGWQKFLEYQERRLPGLKRRYNLMREYMRSAEDEQTGN